MSQHTREKAARLLAEGQVEPDLNNSQIFTVIGSSGRAYWPVVIEANRRFCPCDATTECSHIEAAVLWVLAAAHVKTEYMVALADRKTRDGRRQ